MRLLKRAIFACLLTLTSLSCAQAENWTVYGNPRFGVFAEYPADLFQPLPPPENGDGLSFRSRDGASLAIFGSNNIDGASPAAYESSLRSGGGDDYANVTYRASGAGWLVLSGLRGSDIFYEKYLFSRDLVLGMVMTYPQALKAEYDPIAARIAKSLSAHKVEVQ
jgi:hypothetical protein